MTTENRPPQRQKLLFIKDVEQIIGRSRQTIRRWCEKNKFPHPIKLNDTVRAWRAEVIYQWINDNMGEIYHGQ